MSVPPILRDSLLRPIRDRPAPHTRKRPAQARQGSESDPPGHPWRGAVAATGPGAAEEGAGRNLGEEGGRAHERPALCSGLRPERHQPGSAALVSISVSPQAGVTPIPISENFSRRTERAKRLAHQTGPGGGRVVQRVESATKRRD